MSEKIVNWIVGVFGGLAAIKFGKEILVFIISLLPILELRGGLLAASLLGLNPLPSYIITMIGNLIPIPFILWFITKILDWMRGTKHLSKFANWLDKKVDKHKSSIEKYGFFRFNPICWSSTSWNWCLDWKFNCICFRYG